MADPALWGALALCAAVTFAPRALGVALSGRINPNGAAFRWVGCVAYALLAGLIARMLLLPVGPLQETAFWARVAAVAVALGVFYAARRNLPLAVLAGTLTLIVLNAEGMLFG